jgi:mannose-6-phosphate isomerase-like protein (cupin superfamily)
VRGFQHRPFPAHSALWSGRLTPYESSFQSDQLQIWYNHTDHSWVGAGEPPHFHRCSDECFVVLRGALIVEVDGQRHRIGPREFCCFPAELVHAIVAVETPVETLMIRAPSTDDKIYPPAAA